jgi:hypothetical protein
MVRNELTLGAIHLPNRARRTFRSTSGTKTFYLTSTRNIGGSSAVRAACQAAKFMICQDRTGGRTFTWP